MIIFEGDDPSNSKNFRPITLENVFLKVNTGTPEVKIAEVRLQNSCKSVLGRGYKLTSIYSNSNTSDCIGPS